MKIAVASTSADMSGSVASKLGTAPHVLLIETDDMSFEALEGLPPSSGPGAGTAIISMAVGCGAQAVLAGYVAPHIVNAMKGRGVDIVSGVRGTVIDAVTDYLHSVRDGAASAAAEPGVPAEAELWAAALKKGLRQFYQLLPRLCGVILLLGLFRGFLPDRVLLTMFSGSYLKDTFLGASLGSVLAGNPVNSYVIGDSLLNAGVGQAGVLALMLTWVNVGIVQLPAEAAALGTRFSVVRNFCGFALAVLMSFAVALAGGIG